MIAAIYRFTQSQTTSTRIIIKTKTITEPDRNRLSKNMQFIVDYGIYLYVVKQNTIEVKHLHSLLTENDKNVFKELALQYDFYDEIQPEILSEIIRIKKSFI